MRYKVILHRNVRKALKRIDAVDYRAVIARLDLLSENPYFESVKRLHGVPLWRDRVRDYRIVFNIDDSKREIFVVRVERRSERTYKNL